MSSLNPQRWRLIPLFCPPLTRVLAFSQRVIQEHLADPSDALTSDYLVPRFGPFLRCGNESSSEERQHVPNSVGDSCKGLGGWVGGWGRLGSESCGICQNIFILQTQHSITDRIWVLIRETGTSCQGSSWGSDISSCVLRGSRGARASQPDGGGLSGLPPFCSVSLQAVLIPPPPTPRAERC